MEYEAFSLGKNGTEQHIRIQVERMSTISISNKSSGFGVRASIRLSQKDMKELAEYILKRLPE